MSTPSLLINPLFITILITIKNKCSIKTANKLLFFSLTKMTMSENNNQSLKVLTNEQNYREVSLQNLSFMLFELKDRKLYKFKTYILKIAKQFLHFLIIFLIFFRCFITHFISILNIYTIIQISKQIFFSGEVILKLGSVSLLLH